MSEQNTTKQQEKIQPVIKIKNLSVNYFLGKANEVKALKDINLEIYPGEFIIFFGPSGCGKSTLLYSIAGLEKNISGSIYFDNKNIAELDDHELEKFHQNKTGMIFQAYYLINSLNVLDNVILPQIALGAKTWERKKKALGILEHFGVKEQATKLPNELSGGQQQRVAISRSLINEPDVLLADEPIGNLDSKSATDVMALLKDLNKRQKKTVILVTHNPAYLDFAHRVFYIKDGEITSIKVNELISKEMAESKKGGISIAKDLELLARTFSSISNSAGNLLIPFKAKQIVSEVLTGMSSEEVCSIENKVANLLMTGLYEDKSLFSYLDESVKKGGLGMDKRTAEALSDKIKNIIKEIKYLEREENKINLKQDYDVDEEVKQIRQYLFEVFDINISNIETVKIINQVIKNRLDNKIGRTEVLKIFDLPLNRGGAGLDKRLARKVSKRLELLILGKYK